MSDRLSTDEVRHVAKLARLHLGDDEIDRYRIELSSVLEHVGRLSAIDVTDVEPLSHPIELANRLDDDEVGDAMPAAQLLALAPAVEGGYIAVPKVLD